MKCKVCGYKMKLEAKDRYEILNHDWANLKANYLEAFDCKKCGCQNIVNVREIKRETNKNEMQ